MLPDYDAYRDDDDDAPKAPETFAASAQDLWATRRFVGGVFRFPDLDADDSALENELEYLIGFTEEAPGTLADIIGTHGPGRYRILTAPGFPSANSNRITIKLGKQKAPASPIVAPNATPVVPAANIERMKREAADAARAEIEHEKDVLSREVRRLKLEAADSEETLARARREADRLASDANTLRESLATAQNDGIRYRTELAETAMRHAQETAEAARDAADEIDGYRAELAQLTADMTVRDFELASARRGDASPEGSPYLDLAKEALPHLGTFIDRFVEKVAEVRAEPRDAALAMPYPTPAVPSHFETSGAYGGDGSAGPPAVPFAPTMPFAAGDGAAGLHARSFSERPEDADVATLDPGAADGAADGGADPLGVIAQAVTAVIEGAAPVPPAEIARLVQQGQAAGAVAEDWRALVSDILTRAVAAKAAPEPLADLLAPLVEPFRDRLTPVMKAPAALAVQLIMSEIGVAVPAKGSRWLASLFTALKARL